MAPLLTREGAGGKGTSVRCALRTFPTAALAPPHTRCHRPPVKFLRPSLLLLAVLLFAGCVTPLGRSKLPQHYRKITVTDYHGNLVAEWIAEGNVWRRGAGYRFVAVQRITPPPFVTTSHFAQGRKVLIDGPHITVAPCGKPDWLYEIDGF